MSPSVPDLDDLRAAATRVADFVVCTPVLESALLNEELGFRLLVKAESLQRTGAFKLRGAYHKVSQLAPAERGRGLVAFSSGNHAQAVACVAHHFGVPAHIVMPTDAPEVKREATARWGARLVLFDRQTQDREAIAAGVLAEQGGVLIKPFDDREILLGQGTAVWEALAQCRAMGAVPGRVYVPCSGGGLLAGSALAASGDGIPVTACEPEGFDSAGAALRAGRIAPAYDAFPEHSTLCDALLSPRVGEQCYPLIARHVDRAETVTDEDICAAMRVAFHALRLVVEPGGAAGLAVALRRKTDRQDCVLVLVSGGNVDFETYQACLSA